jgi:hypothetical protein
MVVIASTVCIRKRSKTDLDTWGILAWNSVPFVALSLRHTSFESFRCSSFELNFFHHLRIMLSANFTTSAIGRRLECKKLRSHLKSYETLSTACFSSSPPPARLHPAISPQSQAPHNITKMRSIYDYPQIQLAPLPTYPRVSGACMRNFMRI